MQAFSYWHTYYDSAFASYPFKIPNILYSDLQISSTIGKWPAITFLPQLAKLFQLLEEAILAKDNWIERSFSQKEMQDFESEVNLIVVNLQCQKKYGAEFWGKDIRRVQSSIVHFYLYFKNFISTLIPKDLSSLFQASRKQKLAFSFKKLEIFVNDILSCFKAIQVFLFQQSFKQEQLLIKAFLQDFIQLLQNLPKIARKKLTQIPKLMQFICIMSRLEAEKSQSIYSICSIRRKNSTAADNSQQKVQRRSEEKRININSSVQRGRNLSIQMGKESEENSSLNPFSPKDLAKKVRLFKFQQKVRTQTIYRTSKKATVSSFETKQKSGSISIQKSRSPSDQRSISFIEQQRKKRTETQQELRTKEMSFYAKRSTRQTSAGLVNRSKEKSPKRVSNYDHEDFEQERDHKTKKKKGTKLTIKVANSSNLVDLQKGKRRGWGFLREWFQTRLANRKLKAIMNEF